jgi:hypothetical protein
MPRGRNLQRLINGEPNHNYLDGAVVINDNLPNPEKGDVGRVDGFYYGNDGETLRFRVERLNGTKKGETTDWNESSCELLA